MQPGKLYMETKILEMALFKIYLIINIHLTLTIYSYYAKYFI